MTLNIKLAIQGGGAKICALMAVMEAIQELEAAQLLKVTHIAGTSAGALIGCLYSAGIDMKVLKAKLVAGDGDRLIKFFPTLGWRDYVRLYWHGSPFWKTDGLENGLNETFGNIGVNTFTELKKIKGIETSVVAADLGNAAIKVYREGDYIVSSILSSCGLPYYFRTWNKSGLEVIVDGGIAENLPIGLLKDVPEEPVVAITFSPSRVGSPTTLSSFTKAILETAMSNSIERAKGLLSESAVYTIPRDIEIGTFDFEKALKEGMGALYSLAKRDAKDWFEKFATAKIQEREAKAAALTRLEQEERAAKELSEKQNLGVDFWADQSPTTNQIMNQIWGMYKTQHLENKFKYLKCSFAVQANCLLEEGEPLYGSPDWYSYTLTFEPLKEPIYCICIFLAVSADTKFLGQTSWIVRDAKGNVVNTIDVPARNREDPESRELVIFFDPVIQPGSGQYTLLFQDIANPLMGPLLHEKRDVLEFFPRRAAGSIPQIDLILHIPRRLKDSIIMTPKVDRPLGRGMTPQELGSYTAPPNFHGLGWIGENIASDDDFGVDVAYK